MERTILLVDDQRDILRLLRSALDTLKNKDIKILEAPSGEEAILESSRHKVDLLVTDYKLPGMSGVELMHKIRARHPEVKIILVTGTSDKKARDEMINAGALAIFDKPIPMADYLDAVERGLGLVQTIFPPEKLSNESVVEEQRHTRVSDLIANFRQDVGAEAIFLLNDRGLVQARTGAFRDSSMEVSLISSLMAIHGASLKVARYNHQEKLDTYHIFSSGDHDLLFIPVTPLYALLVAGNGLAHEDRVLETIGGLLALRTELERALKSMGVTGELKSASAASQTVPLKQTDKLARAVPAPEMEELLNKAPERKEKTEQLNNFWDEAAKKNANKPINSEVISIEEARKQGLLSDSK